MLNSKYVNQEKNYITHGVKEIGDYTYVLLIDMAGVSLIKRVKSDNTEILFTKKESGSIATFWSDPTIHSYNYFYTL